MKDGVPPKSPNEKSSSKLRRPQPLIKLVMRRLESSFRSFSWSVLRAATRVVQEIGKSRAAAFSLGVYDMDEGTHLQGYSENTDSIDPNLNESSQPEGKSHLLLKDWGTCFSVLVASCQGLVPLLHSCYGEKRNLLYGGT